MRQQWVCLNKDALKDIIVLGRQYLLNSKQVILSTAFVTFLNCTSINGSTAQELVANNFPC